MVLRMDFFSSESALGKPMLNLTIRFPLLPSCCEASKSFMASLSRGTGIPSFSTIFSVSGVITAPKDNVMTRWSKVV